MSPFRHLAAVAVLVGYGGLAFFHRHEPLLVVLYGLILLGTALHVLAPPEDKV